MTTDAPTLYLDRPGGRIAYEVAGEGPLVVCVPGMGDLRSVYRFLVPVLREAGYRVAAMDLRGHGDSDATFDAFDDVAAGTDALALVEHLGAPAVLVGNSMGAGAVTWAAAEAPDRVVALVLFGPFVRNGPPRPLAMFAFRVALLKPWGPAVWRSYYVSSYPGRRPDDLSEQVDRIRESQRRPGRWWAFVQTTHTTHAPVEARLDEVRAPALVVMGERDQDFKDPGAEARFIGERLHGEVLLVPECGHYPQAQHPDVVGPAVTRFLAGVGKPSSVSGGGDR